jgi:WD40-like Beta Propeller Repeat
MSVPTESPKPNRTPWIIAGVLGCLVLCLLVAVVGGGAFVFLGQSQPTAVVRNVPTTAAFPTVVPFVQPTQAPLAQPTQQSLAQPTQQSLAQPTQQSLAQPTQQSLAQPTLGSAGQPTVPPLAPTQAPPVTQPTAPPTATAGAPTGRLAFTVRRGDRPEDNYIWMMNADGSNAKQILAKASEPTFNPDGSKIAYYGWTDGIWVANADGTNPKKVLGESSSGYLSWSHDGRWIAFSVRPGFSGNIATDAIAPDGTGRRPVVVGWSPSWSPDDTQLVFQTCRGSNCGIFKAPSAGGDAVPIVADDGGLPSYSPDGGKIVYQKDVDGQKQLFLINADGSGKKQITQGTSLHVDAAWSSNGNFIFYRSPEGGQWGIWRMNADGSNPVKLANDMPPGDWPYDRIAVTK